MQCVLKIITQLNELALGELHREITVSSLPHVAVLLCCECQISTNSLF